MRTSWWWSVAVLAAFAAGSYAFYVYLQPPKLPSGIIYGNGRVEATEVRIGSEVAGRVIVSRIVESRRYSKGDLLVQIDDRDFKIRLAEAQANRLALMQNRDKMAALAHVGRHHTTTARSNLRRYRALAASNDVSKQQLESVENSLSEAQGLLTVGEASVAQVDAEIAGADQAIALIRDQIAKCRIAAPSDGTILIKSVEPGEVVAAGQPLAVMADLTHLTLKIYVPEYDLGRLTLGGPARVGTDAFPNNYARATIERIDQQAQFTPRDIHMPDERARTVFGVTLAVSNPHGELKPGMPVDAWLKWRSGLPWPEHLVVPE